MASQEEEGIEVALSPPCEDTEKVPACQLGRRPSCTWNGIGGDHELGLPASRAATQVPDVPKRLGCIVSS